MNRKKTIVALAALAVIVVVAGMSVAYFNSEDTADNVFTVGDVKIELTEPGWDPTEDHIIAPDVSFEKKPTVTNKGKNDTYVRVRVTIENYSKVKEALGNVEPDTLFNTGIDPDKWTVATTLEDTQNDSITYRYLYNGVLGSEESTGPLFNEVVFPDSVVMSKVIDLPGDGISIDVTADAIQDQGFDNATEAFDAFDNQNQ